MLRARALTGARWCWRLLHEERVHRARAANATDGRETLREGRESAVLGAALHHVLCAPWIGRARRSVSFRQRRHAGDERCQSKAGEAADASVHDGRPFSRTVTIDGSSHH